MSTREVVRIESSTLKLGVINSEVASVRTQTEAQTAVRVIDGDCIGLASAVGTTDLDKLTRAARENLFFEVPYPVTPQASRSMSVGHTGDTRSVDELVSFTQTILGSLRDEFPGFVFSHGVEQQHLAWHIESDAGLDLHYSRDSTQVAFIAKEKGSGNIVDTFVGVAGAELDVVGILREFRSHLDGYGKIVPPRVGRQKVIFPGLSGMAGAGLLQLIRSDLVARVYAQGASVFDGMVGDDRAHFSPDLSLREIRNPDDARVCPFDMEGVVRDALNLDVIRQGQLVSLAANQRDAQRYGVTATGTAIGDVAQLPSSGFGHLAAAPTAPKLSDLLDEDGALLVWFVAGGDSTRVGDMALPAQVMLVVDGDGRVVGRQAGATLTGNIFDVMGSDFVGVSAEKVDPYSDDSFFVTHMNVNG